MDDPRMGTVLDQRYRIVARLGAGGMGVVYRGERVHLGRRVAIKFLHEWMAGDSSFLKRFEIEARAMARLEHPNCAAVIDFGMDRKQPYVVMDLVSGVPLRDVIDEGPLPVARAIDIARQLLAGLGHAHAQGITHRDIKPDNVMVDSSSDLGDQVRILDFGLARMREAATGLTTGFVVGTPDYMAPEQSAAEPVDARADLYAAGIVLLEMLTGKKPFRADSVIEVLRMQREVPAPRLRELAPEAGLSRELEDVIARALSKAPGDRFASATDFALTLDETAEARSARAPSQPRAGAHAPPQPDNSTIELLTPSDVSWQPITNAHAPPQPDGDTVELVTPPDLSWQPETGAHAPPQPDGNTIERVAAAAPAGALGTAHTAMLDEAASGRGGSASPGDGDPTLPAPHSQPPTIPMAPAPSPAPGHAVPTRRRTGIALGAGLLVAIPVIALVAGGDSPAPSAPDAVVAAGAELHEIARAEAGDSADGEPEAGAEAEAGDSADSEVEAGDPADGETEAGDTADSEVEAGDSAEVEAGDSAEVEAGDSAEPEAGDSADGAAESGARGPEPPELTAIKKLLASGRRHEAAARKRLIKLKRVYPDNAEIRFILGRLYFARLWVSDGLEEFREVLRLAPRYREDPELIRSAINGLAADASHYRARRFLLREIGKPAVPYLKSAAASDPRRRVRERAASALRAF